jgi:hypothetical protein
MSWKDLIQTTSPTWNGLEKYAEERIADLTAVCASIDSTDKDIRVAQAGILELRSLVAIPQRIRAEAQARASTSARKEY